jgi:hypothetical protein
VKAIVLSLLLVNVMAARAEETLPWYDQVRALSADGSQATEVLAKLKQDAKLPEEVCDALKTGNREAEALEITTRLEIQRCWPEVFALVKNGSVWMAVMAAQSLNEKSPREEWKAWLKSSLEPAQWKSLSDEFKLEIIPAAAALKIPVAVKSLKAVFKDKQNDVRENALMLLEQELELHPKDKELPHLMRQSLTQDPYQFRMTAFLMLNHLPADLRKTFKPSVDRCVKVEAEDRVKDACLKLQKSM